MPAKGAAKNVKGFASSEDHVELLSLRLVCLIAMIILLMMHLRSVRVFRWEQAVSGGVIVTYTVAVLGLALCAGIEECGARVFQVTFCRLLYTNVRVFTNLLWLF